MISVEFSKNGNHVSFKSWGHASHDICVAVTALCSAVLQYVRKLESEGSVKITGEKYERGRTETEFVCVKNQPEIHGGFTALLTAIELYAENFPDEVKIKIICKK